MKPKSVKLLCLLLWEEIKRLVHENTVLMMVMSLILSFLTQGQAIDPDILAPQMNAVLRVEGLFLLFLYFALEYAKFTLIPDKSTKRLEFLLANGLSLWQIFTLYVSSILIATTCTLLPSYAFLWSQMNPLILVYILVQHLVLTIWIVVTCMRVENMNKVNSFQILLSLLFFVILAIAFLCYNATKTVPAFMLCKTGLIFFIIAITALPINKERLIQSYY